jgi:hypothetical protein
MIIHLHTRYHMSMSSLKKVITWIRKFPKINYLTLRSEVKVMWRSWWSITQHIMIIQLHTKYHKYNSKDKRVTAEQGHLSIKRIRRRKSPIKTICLPSFLRWRREIIVHVRHLNLEKRHQNAQKSCHYCINELHIKIDVDIKFYIFNMKFKNHLFYLTLVMLQNN